LTTSTDYYGRLLTDYFCTTDTDERLLTNIGSYLVLVDPFQKTEIGEKEEKKEKKKREKKRKKRERRKEKRRKMMASYIEFFGVGRKLIKDLETHWFISI